jgi:MYXO-CTERM domain-containing protein
MRYTLVVFILLALPLRSDAGPITYSLRDARFFGDVPSPSRELSSSGTVTSVTEAALPATYSTGGPFPVTFTGNATTDGAPLELRATNTVVAASATDLQFNAAPFGDTTLVTLVQSSLQESSVLVTGSSGSAFLLPHFLVEGTFIDAHASAYGHVGVCAGISGCSASTLAVSSGGVQTMSLAFTPTIGALTAFTFGTPLSHFFFLTSGISSTTSGTLSPGSVSADFRVRLLGFSVVDGAGNDIPGAVVQSDLTPVPEPAAGALVLLGLAALRRRYRPAAR